jgi:hypothetical protein
MGSEGDGTVENPINREPDMKHLVQRYILCKHHALRPTQSLEWT